MHFFTGRRVIMDYGLRFLDAGFVLYFLLDLFHLLSCPDDN